MRANPTYRVASRTATPPGSPAEGDAVLVIATATGAFASYENAIATYRFAAWRFVRPERGSIVWSDADAAAYQWDGTTYSATGSSAPALAAGTGAAPLTPSQITGNQNDYAPTGHATAAQFRLSTDASREITGLAGGAAGRVVRVLNVGAQYIVLKNESASSTAANRFTLGADVTIPAGYALELQYDGTTSRWVYVGAAGPKLRANDADVGFADPNAHFEASEASLRALIEELGFLLKEQDAAWLPGSVLGVAQLGNQTTTFASPFYVRACSGSSDTTIYLCVMRIPVWYESSSVKIRVTWTPAAPVHGEVWRLRVASHAGFNVNEAVPALTNLDTSITLDTGVHVAGQVYVTEVTLSTVPTEGKTFANFGVYRRASSDGADTHTGQINIIGVEVVSGRYST